MVMYEVTQKSFKKASIREIRVIILKNLFYSFNHFWGENFESLGMVWEFFCNYFLVRLERRRVSRKEEYFLVQIIKLGD